MNTVTQHIYSANGTIFFAFITSMIVCFLITPVVIKIVNLKQLMDEPNARSSHVKKTATLGGLSIFAAILIGYTIWGNFTLFHGLSMQYIISSLVILFFIGLKDDILELKPVSKLLAQILAALIVVYGAKLKISSLFGLFGIVHIHPYLAIALTVFIFVIIINSYNLIDGIDGLAASIGLVVTISFGFWFYKVGHTPLTILSACLAGALIGFMRYNFSRKEKIFMGDTGSMIVGFMLAVFTIKFIQMNEAPYTDFYIPNAPTLAIAVLIVPLFDTLRVLSMRIIHRRPPFYPDRSHIHHILIDKGFSHIQASGLLFGSNILIILLTLYFLRDASPSWSALGIVGLFVLYSFIFRKSSSSANFNPEKEMEQNPQVGETLES